MLRDKAKSFAYILERVVEGEHVTRSHPLQTYQLIRLRTAATSFPKVPEGGGGGGGALGVEFEPPCGPSEARATVGIANVSNAIRHRLDTATLSFFISILLVYFATINCDFEVEGCAHLSRNSLT